MWGPRSLVLALAAAAGLAAAQQDCSMAAPAGCTGMTYAACVAAGNGSALVCTPWTECASGAQFAVQTGNATHDRACAACTPCTAGSMYRSAGCDGLTDSVCLACTPCAAGLVQNGGCDGILDRMCGLAGTTRFVIATDYAGTLLWPNGTVWSSRTAALEATVRAAITALGRGPATVTAVRFGRVISKLGTLVTVEGVEATLDALDTALALGTLQVDGAAALPVSSAASLEDTAAVGAQDDGDSIGDTLAIVIIAAVGGGVLLAGLLFLVRRLPAPANDHAPRAKHDEMEMFETQRDTLVGHMDGGADTSAGHEYLDIGFPDRDVEDRGTGATGGEGGDESVNKPDGASGDGDGDGASDRGDAENNSEEARLAAEEAEAAAIAAAAEQAISTNQVQHEAQLKQLKQAEMDRFAEENRALIDGDEAAAGAAALRLMKGTEALLIAQQQAEQERNTVLQARRRMSVVRHSEQQQKARDQQEAQRLAIERARQEEEDMQRILEENALRVEQFKREQAELALREAAERKKREDEERRERLHREAEERRAEAKARADALIKEREEKARQLKALMESPDYIPCTNLFNCQCPVCTQERQEEAERRAASVLARGEPAASPVEVPGSVLPVLPTLAVATAVAVQAADSDDDDAGFGFPPE